MNFDNFGFFGENLKDDRVPEVYQEFLPLNIVLTKDSNPYTYDPFLIYFNEEEQKATGCVYSDRLLEWDYDKYNRLCREYFGNEGQSWDKRDSNKIEEFLCDYFDKKVVLVANIQYVNVSNGYPVWRFDFCEVN